LLLPVLAVACFLPLFFLVVIPEGDLRLSLPLQLSLPLSLPLLVFAVILSAAKDPGTTALTHISNRNVISTEATDSLIVRRAAERPLYFPSALSKRDLQRDQPVLAFPGPYSLFSLSSPKITPKREIPNKHAAKIIF
jgi:hypothetical protein